MNEQKICRGCSMPFDWPGVVEGGEEFCCDECAAGLPCTCPQHDHRTDRTEEKLTTAV